MHFIKINEAIGNLKAGESYLCSSKLADQLLTIGNNQKPHSVVPDVQTFNELFNAYKGQDLTDKKLFIWTFGGVEELLLAILPLAGHLKSQFPTCKIALMCDSSFHQIVEGSAIDEKVIYPIDKTAFIA